MSLHITRDDVPFHVAAVSSAVATSKPLPARESLFLQRGFFFGYLLVVVVVDFKTDARVSNL